MVACIHAILRHALIVGYFLSVMLAANTAVSAQEDNGDDAATAQDQLADLKELLKVEELRIPVIYGEIDFDGRIDEGAWKYAATYEITLETYPARLEPALVKTTVFVGRYNDDLVFAFDAHDPDPSKIQAPRRDRDGIELDDYVGISIDPSGNLIETYEFYVNARGVQGDWVRNRVDDTRARDWEADWEAAAEVTGTGYQVQNSLLP